MSGRIWVDVDGAELAIKKLDVLNGQMPEVEHSSGFRSAELIAGMAKSRIPIGPIEGGHVKGTIMATVSPTGPMVTGGGPGFPYYGWLDFGGRVGKNRSTLRRYIRGTGRYIWRSFVDAKLLVERNMDSALESAIRRSGLGGR